MTCLLETHDRIESSVADRLRRIRALRQAERCDWPLFQQVGEVILLASSSRGGSSVFARLLQGCPRLLHFCGEINPYLVLAGLSYPQSDTGSDQLGPEHARDTGILEQEMAFGVGNPLDRLCSEADLWRFALDLTWRLTIQWPEERFRPEEVFAWLHVTLRRLQRSRGWACGEIRDLRLFYLCFLRQVRARHPRVNPNYYDLPRSWVRRWYPEIPAAEGPPSARMIEEPPFVLAGPWRQARPEHARTRPLLIKTPSNAYRLPFWQQLFPRARLRVLHLTRNPAAAIHGLCEGWQSAGFYSHCLGLPLRIARYSDAFPEWGSRWWKFDLPPGWTDWTADSLVHVCGFQWRAAHEAILNYSERSQVDYFRVRFEDIQGSRERRTVALAQLGRWLGIEELAAVSSAFETLPPVMATGRPRQGRWRRRAKLLGPVLNDSRIRQMAERLGYGQCTAEWI